MSPKAVGSFFYCKPDAWLYVDGTHQHGVIGTSNRCKAAPAGVRNGGAFATKPIQKLYKGRRLRGQNESEREDAKR